MCVRFSGWKTDIPFITLFKLLRRELGSSSYDTRSTMEVITHRHVEVIELPDIEQAQVLADRACPLGVMVRVHGRQAHVTGTRDPGAGPAFADLLVAIAGLSPEEARCIAERATQPPPAFIDVGTREVAQRIAREAEQLGFICEAVE